MTALEAAYLAGLLDGEGCIAIRTRPDGWVNACLEICMTDRRPLDWAARVTGAGRVYSGIEGRSNRRQPYHWKVGSVAAAAAILRQVEPFMQVKRGQAKAFLVLGHLRAAKSRATGPRDHGEAEHALARIVRHLKDAGQ
jgi:hypothetical protein